MQFGRRKLSTETTADDNLRRRQHAYWEKVLPTSDEPSLDIITGESAVPPPRGDGKKISHRISRQAWRQTFLTTDEVTPQCISDSPPSPSSKAELLERLRNKGISVMPGLELVYELPADKPSSGDLPNIREQ